MNEWMDVPKSNNEQRKVTADAGGKSVRSYFFMKVGGRRDLKERCEEGDWKEKKWRQKSVRRRRRRREKLNAVTRHTHRCVCISPLRGLEAILSVSGFPTYHLIYDQRPPCLCICVSVDVVCVIKPLLIILSAGVTQKNKGTPLPSSQPIVRYLPSLCRRTNTVRRTQTRLSQRLSSLILSLNREECAAHPVTSKHVCFLNACASYSDQWPVFLPPALQSSDLLINRSIFCLSSTIPACIWLYCLQLEGSGSWKVCVFPIH